MNSYIFADASGTFVEYKTDALSAGFGNFTVFQVKGLDSTEETAGLQFKQLAYDLESFIALAEDNSYTLMFFNPRVGNAEFLIGGFTIAALADGSTASEYTESLDLTTPFDNPVEYEVTGGALPDGVTLGTDGTFSGTPTETGTFTFTVTVTDIVFNVAQDIELELTVA